MTIAAMVGYLGTGLLYAWWVALPVGALLLILLLFSFGKNPDLV
jgi:hypothetical protein